MRTQVAQTRLKHAIEDLQRAVTLVGQSEDVVPTEWLSQSAMDTDLKRAWSRAYSACQALADDDPDLATQAEARAATLYASAVRGLRLRAGYDDPLDTIKIQLGLIADPADLDEHIPY